ncbi:THUMP domain-containing protein 3 [Pristis pectinata]|uniref:THUMP domain-containing protein 3 n=1 Tax=Pristis pectinata TaxID=685728 RepID=UPI00223C8D77|nr:THUMP domain-containing protein 3 [Pristis pectinata]XP_051873826.1 THUMP domain-containing protein 3 [Pristis pectinata]XP_051873827.1 THUMP domain-containing protein 3 [Pristis pectinata]
MSEVKGDADGPNAAATVSEVEGGPCGNKDVPIKQNGCLLGPYVTIGATVPTGFEKTAADEVQEKIGSESRISKDRGRIYFEVSTDNLFQVHLLRSVDNLFVVVQEFPHYQFNKSKESILEDFRQLAGQLPWANPLEVWELNNSLKKRKFQRRKANQEISPASGTPHEIDKNSVPMTCAHLASGDQLHNGTVLCVSESGPSGDQLFEIKESTNDVVTNQVSLEGHLSDRNENEEKGCKLLKFRVTCNRAGEKHTFTSMEAAREFGGAVQDLFKWKADMTKFDIEILLNIHDTEVVIGIALTEESLHRRNIVHFGPTTLRSTLAYGMLRLCSPQLTDIIVDPMCGTGAIPIEGALEFTQSYFLGGDNNVLAVNRSINNINSLQKKRLDKGRTNCGLPLDVVQWDICNLPLKTSSVDIIISDMPFGKRIGSKRKNWDLYPACLKEMGRVCRPETGRAALLTQDKKCFVKAMSRMGYLWRKSHTVWVNVGGLHAAVYLLKRTSLSFNELFKTPQESDCNKDIPCKTGAVE